MKLILAFLPWIVFGALSHHYPLQALLVALTLTTGQVVSHRRNPKILEIASFSFFAFASVALILFRWEALAHHLGLVVHLLLASIAWGSLGAGVPFTLQYAREEVPEERWSEPAFLSVNRWITAVWGVDFLLQAAVLEWQAAYGGLLPSLLSTVLTGLALAFTLGLPRWSRRQGRRASAGS